MKQRIAAILTVLLLALLCPVAAFAAEIYTEGYYQYQIEDGAAAICGYFGDKSEVTVPAAIAGMPVSKIAAGAFADTSVATVHLPDTIVTIEAGAFSDGTRVIEATENIPNPTQQPAQTPPPAQNDGATERPTGATATPTAAPGATAVPAPTKAPTQQVVAAPTAQPENGDLAEGGYEEPESLNDTTLAVNEQKHLVAVDAAGNTTVLDDTQTYTARPAADGTLQIQNEAGQSVALAGDGTLATATPAPPMAPSAETAETAAPAKGGGMALPIAGAVAAVLLVGGGLWLAKHRKN